MIPGMSEGYFERATKCDKKYNYFVCKGDGDQDRPN